MKTIIVKYFDNIGALKTGALLTNEELSVDDIVKVKSSVSDLNQSRRNGIKFEVVEIINKEFKYVTNNGDLLEDFTNINCKKIENFEFGEAKLVDTVYGQKVDSYSVN